MAKRKATQNGRKPVRKAPARSGGRSKPAKAAKRAAKRPAKKAAAKASTRGARKKSQPRSTTRPLGRSPARNQGTRTKASRLDRERRRLEETVPTPPSSLDMKRRGTSARSGRHEMAENLDEHAGMTSLTGGDVDADFENAYFSGDEAPGGDNPTPDQDIVDDIGRSIGVEYQDNEELKAADKVTERDKHRWELDPASSEDYKDRE